MEFGLVRDNNNPSTVKAYGAGVLSSFGELEYSCKGSSYPSSTDDTLESKAPRLVPWNPKVLTTLTSTTIITTPRFYSNCVRLHVRRSILYAPINHYTL